MTCFGLDCTPGIYSTASPSQRYIQNIWGLCKNADPGPGFQDGPGMMCFSQALGSDATGIEPSVSGAIIMLRQSPEP